MRTINFKNYQVKTISLKEGLCNQILTEVYKKSDKSLFLSFFRNLRDYLLGKKARKDFDDFNTKNHFGLFQIESGLSGYYDISENRVKDDYAAEIINTYKNPKCKNSKKFFRAFFDVLQNNDL